MAIDLIVPTNADNYPDFFRGAHRKLREHESDLEGRGISLGHPRFGAKGDGVTDDTAAILRWLETIPEDGGLGVVPAGQYLHSAGLPVSGKTNLTLRGMGKQASVFISAHTGSGLVSREPINTGLNNVHLALEDLGFTNTNGANTGAGFEQVGGTHVHVRRCRIIGFKYGVILDQSELTDIDLCDIELQLTGGIWLCNGPDHTPGASTFFTNRISITRCQINNHQTVGTTGILDDGGNCHAIKSCNFNGWERHIRCAGVIGGTVEGQCEFEGALEESILSTSNSHLGTTAIGVSPLLKIDSNLFVPAAGKPCISFGGGDCLLLANLFSTSTTPLVGVGNLGLLVALANQTDAAALTTTQAGWLHLEGGRPPTAAGPFKVSTLLVNGGTSRVEGTTAEVVLKDTNGAADEKVWRWLLSGNTLSLQTLNDAENTAGGVLFFDRVGNSPFSITFQIGVIAQSNLTIGGALDHDGSTAGFFGVAPTTRPTLAAAATDPATTQTLANSIRSALIALGLCQ